MGRILILEDDYLQAAAMERVLCGAGHKVVGLAPDAQTAFGLARECTPDLLLCDLRLRNQLEGAAAAAELARIHGCKVLIITGYPDSVSLAADVETCGVVGKPWSEAALLEAVEECLRDAAPTRAA